MEFTGIASAVLLQAAAALGLLVVGLYILKLRRRPVAVPFGPLWAQVLGDEDASSWFQRLRRLLSLLLQLFLLALLLLALGDPRWAVGEDEGRHVVVLIDASASMKATAPDADDAAGAPSGQSTTRLEAAKREVHALLQGLSGADRMLIAQMDAAVTPLSTMTQDVPELEAALEQVRAYDVRAGFPQALRFALDALSGLSNPEIVVVSDGALGEAADGQGAVALGDVTLSYLPVGEAGRNVAISGLSVRRYPLDKSRYEVLLEVINSDEESADVEIELYGDGELSDLVNLRLEGKETLSRLYPNLSGAERTLEARIRLKGAQKDILAADDRAYAVLPERRRARIQVVTPGNMYLEAALLLDEYLDVTTVAPSAYPAAGQFDVTIFDGVAPALSAESGQAFYLNPPDDTHTPFQLGKKLKSDRSYTLGFDKSDSKHPLLRHVMSLGDVHVARGRALKPGRGDRVVAASFKGALLLAGRREGRKFAALGFDVRDSDLPLRVAWPLLVLNVINYFIEEDPDHLSSYVTGRVWHIPAPDSAMTGRLELPSGESKVVPIKDGRAYFLGQEAGYYRLAVGKGPDLESTLFAGNLVDPLESQVTPAEQLLVGERSGQAPAGFSVGIRQELWVYLLLAGLLLTLLEWLSYHRRVTV